jgi:hypothetical protein
VDLAGILAQHARVAAQLGGIGAVLGGIAAHLTAVAPSGLMLLAAAALACVLARFLTRGTRLGVAATFPSARAVTMRAKSRRTAYLRQRDPGAAGRVRPRAPSGCPAAA